MANYNPEPESTALPAAAAAAIPNPFPPPDPRRHDPPFIAVPDVHNFRHLPALAIPPSTFPSSSSTSTKPLHLRQDIVFRSGEPSRITPAGIATLTQTLRVRTVFDLRSADEIAKHAARTPAVAIPGAQRVHAPTVRADAAQTPEQHRAHLALYTQRDGRAGFAAAYMEILAGGGDAFGKVLGHVRDRPGEALLVHCTAGKDRTGVLVALALALLGVGDEEIAGEYALTEPGLSEWAPRMFDVLVRNPQFVGAGEGEEGKEDEGVVVDVVRSTPAEKIVRLASAKRENMVAFLERLRGEWGGAEGYLKAKCGFGDEDLEKIKRNLVE